MSFRNFITCYNVNITKYTNFYSSAYSLLSTHLFIYTNKTMILYFATVISMQPMLPTHIDNDCSDIRKQFTPSLNCVTEVYNEKNLQIEHIKNFQRTYECFEIL